MKNRVQEALNNILEMFKTGNLPGAIARTVIRAKAGDCKPSDSWSMGNKILMFIAGTEDARGYKQWQVVGRQVKKGAKAFYILAPCTKKVTRKVVDPDTGEEKEEERAVITGFKDIPVFRLEDTEGEPLPEYDYSPPELPPLFGVAEKFGVKVKYLPGDRVSEYGHYNFGRKEIVLRSHDVGIFFHELAHAVHDTFKKLKGGQHSDQEIIAETVAAVLCELYGYREYTWNNWKYVKHYASNDPKKALRVIFSVLSDVEEILKRIFDAAEKDTAA